MTNQVQCFITIVTGAPEHGKSKRTEDELKMYVLNDVKIGRKGRPVLIFDTNNEYGHYRELKYNVADESDNGRYLALHRKPEIRRIAPFAYPGKVPMNFEQKEKTLKDIMTYFRNGCVLLEDINTYLDDFNSLEVISFLCNNRHRGLDIIIHLQSLAAVSTRMWQNAKIVRFHYQADNIDRYRDRIPNYELMKIAQCIVNYNYIIKKDKYFFLYVDVRTNKIVGVDKQKFIQGCMEYVTKYGSKEIKEEMQFKKLDRKAAITSIIRKKMQLYLQ
jgi:hypothetical protein